MEQTSNYGQYLHFYAFFSFFPLFSHLFPSPLRSLSPLSLRTLLFRLCLVYLPYAYTHTHKQIKTYIFAHTNSLTNRLRHIPTVFTASRRGSISAEHGLGLMKAPHLKYSKGIFVYSFHISRDIFIFFFYCYFSHVILSYFFSFIVFSCPFRPACPLFRLVFLCSFFSFHLLP